jgi:hypothetical protein
MEETLRQHLIALAEKFEACTGTAAATIGRRALNDNKVFARLEAGDGFTIRTFDRLTVWFSENWPDGAEWPEALERPTPAAQAPESVA